MYIFVPKSYTFRNFDGRSSNIILSFGKKVQNLQNTAAYVRKLSPPIRIIGVGQGPKGFFSVKLCK